MIVAIAVAQQDATRSQPNYYNKLEVKTLDNKQTA